MSFVDRDSILIVLCVVGDASRSRRWRYCHALTRLFLHLPPEDFPPSEFWTRHLSLSFQRLPSPEDEGSPRLRYVNDPRKPAQGRPEGEDVHGAEGDNKGTDSIHQAEDSETQEER